MPLAILSPTLAEPAVADAATRAHIGSAVKANWRRISERVGTMSARMSSSTPFSAHVALTGLHLDNRYGMTMRLFCS